MKRKKTEDNYAKPIYSFFSKSKNSTITQNVSDFYEQHLPNIPQSVAEEEPVEDQNIIEENKKLKQEIEDLKKENAKLHEESTKSRKDLASLLKVHRETCRMYVNKELKLKLAEKIQITPEKRQDRVLYDTFQDDFGEEALRKLRSISGVKRNDSTFILECMRALFNVDELKNKSACGTDKCEAIPKIKRDILENIFLERLKSKNLSDIDINERYMRMNRLINISISNITRKKVNKFIDLSDYSFIFMIYIIGKIKKKSLTIKFTFFSQGKR